MLVVGWYLRFGLSYRDLEERLAERGVEVDHVTVHRWVQRFTPLSIDAARPCRDAVERRWFVDETYVNVAGVWRYVYRAVDGYGQVINVCNRDHHRSRVHPESRPRPQRTWCRHTSRPTALFRTRSTNSPP